MRFSELEGARVGVWGAGREIRSFARQLKRRLPGARIVTAVFDGSPPAGVQELLGDDGLRLAGAADAVEAVGGCDVIVRSPGVSVHRPELVALREAGLPVTTATGLWLGERGGERVIGVTGTKGKSTTAALAWHLLCAAGEPAVLAGNIGVPALDLLDADDGAVAGPGASAPSPIAVVELSSYQIADLEDGPRVAVFTNLFSEHLDWHGTRARYRADKLRLASLPGVRHVVYNARDEGLRPLAGTARSVAFGTAAGWDATSAGIVHGGALVAAGAALPLRGTHNALNACAALAAIEAFGAPSPADPAAALAAFQALPHRLQAVHDGGGVTWVDDSISTTPESALAALASYPDSDLVLIAGGQDRGQDYDALARALAQRGATLLAIGTTGPALAAAARAAGMGPADAIEAGELARAVSLARDRARPGTVVLLSPAAPSFDGFRDFEDRGDQFAALARGG
jgi:UDP-N-acetylmuramoylalanine--D-glutamate ligase